MSSEGGKVDVDMEAVRAFTRAEFASDYPELRDFEERTTALIRSHVEAERLRHVRETANVESTFNVLHLRAQQAEELCMAYERAAPGKRERLEVASRLMAASVVGWATDDATGMLRAWRLDLTRTCAQGDYETAKRAASDPYFGTPTAELPHFCRRVREALGVDEPAWKRLPWEDAGEDSDPGDADTLTHLVARLPDGMELSVRSENAVAWRGYMEIVADDGERFLLHEIASESEDACKAALHDALVSFHLRGLRAAMGDDR